MSATTGYQPLSQITPQQLAQAFGTCDLYTYEADFGTVNSGAQATFNLTIQADSNFLWQKSAYYADIANAAFTVNTQPVPNMTVLMTDTSSGRQLMSSPMPVTSLFGLGRELLELPTPRFFRANTQITLLVNNFDAAVNYDLRLSLIGTKFFNYSA